MLIPAVRHDALKYVLEVVVMLDLEVVGLSEPDGCDQAVDLRRTGQISNSGADILYISKSHKVFIIQTMFRAYVGIPIELVWVVVQLSSRATAIWKVKS